MIFIEREAISLAPELDSLWTVAAQTALDTSPEFVSADLTLVFVGDDEIRDLNNTYRGIDSPTDVLSFASGEVDPESGIYYLGDIILSFPRAVEQSAKAGHPVENEIRLLIVHGVLHLLGYDHTTEAEKNTMWQKQASILQSIGCEIFSLPEGE
jgi:probable rRNA maturation factor